MFIDKKTWGDIGGACWLLFDSSCRAKKTRPGRADLQEASGVPLGVGLVILFGVDVWANFPPSRSDPQAFPRGFPYAVFRSVLLISRTVSTEVLWQLTSPPRC